MNINKLKEEQIKLAKKLILTDNFEKIETIAGLDFIYTEDKIICTIVVLDYKTKEVIEKKYSIEKLTLPYIPGFLSYRVVPAATKVWEKIEKKPDVMIVGANGILHPRKIGAASAIGLFLDVATIGVAKKRLCGEERENSVYLDKEAIGKKIETRDKAKPIYVSQGHKIGLTTTMETVKDMLIGHKLPEPLYLAHKYGNKVKKRLSEGDAENKEDSDKEEDTE